MEYREKLIQQRKTQQISQRKLASMSGVSAATISKFENGQIKNMGVDTLRLLANALKLPLIELLLDEYSNSEYATKPTVESLTGSLSETSKATMMFNCPQCGYKGLSALSATNFASPS